MSINRKTITMIGRYTKILLNDQPVNLNANTSRILYCRITIVVSKILLGRGYINELEISYSNKHVI